MANTSKRLLLIFVKHPEKGKSKTRLAKGIGHEKALEVYRKLLAYTCTLSQSISCDKAVFYGNQMPDQDLWSEANYPRFQQVGEDLGARMKHAFDWGFSQGYEEICIIGSDCASLDTEILNQAFETLSNQDFVIGPAIDGGYYLMGMTYLLGPLFEGKVWSTSTVLQEALADIEAAGKSYGLLPPLSDVDVVEDLRGTFLASYIPE